jgi:hypothetical protein
MIRVYLEPRVVIKCEDFIEKKPRFSIALDGYVKGPPRFSIQGPYANFNHHEGVARIATRSTCAQVYYYIRLGLLDTFQKNGHPRAGVYINDVDQDVCLYCWLLKNSEKLEGLRFDHLLVQLFSKKMRAYVALVEGRKGRYTYTIGKMSPFVMFPGTFSGILPRRKFNSWHRN